MPRQPPKPETPRAAPVIGVIRHRPPELGRCRADTCRREVEWVTTEKGRRMPIDHPLRVLRTHERLDGQLVVIVDAAQSHFATCPEAPRFSKRTRRT